MAGEPRGSWRPNTGVSLAVVGQHFIVIRQPVTSHRPTQSAVNEEVGEPEVHVLVATSMRFGERFLVGVPMPGADLRVARILLDVGAGDRYPAELFDNVVPSSFESTQESFDTGKSLKTATHHQLDTTCLISRSKFRENERIGEEGAAENDRLVSMSALE